MAAGSCIFVGDHVRAPDWAGLPTGEKLRAVVPDLWNACKRRQIAAKLVRATVMVHPPWWRWRRRRRGFVVALIDASSPMSTMKT